MTAAPARLDIAVETEAEQIHISRVFPVARESAFRAWTDPQQLIDWWGRHDFTNPSCEFDARVGGNLRIVMHSPDGIDYPLHGIVREIDPPSKLTLTLDLSQYPQPWRDFVSSDLSEADAALVNEHDLALHFTDSGTSTRLDLHIRFPSPSLREAFLRCGILDGWSEGLDSLNALLTRSGNIAS